MKKKTIRICVGVGVCMLLLALIVTILLYEWITTKTVQPKSIRSAALLMISCVLFALRYFGKMQQGTKGRRKQYETIYRDILEHAFCRREQKKQRARLLRAIAHYNDNAYAAAIRSLEALKHECKTKHEEYAVLLFLALTYTDMGAEDEAIGVYEKILRFDSEKSTVWSNLGMLYLKQGEMDHAVECYQKAIDCDPSNPFPYNNTASALIKMAEFEKAIPFAEKALELKSNLTAASNALAICHSVLGNQEKANQYFRISLANGADARELKSAIALYCEEI